MTQYTKRQVADRIFMSIVVMFAALLPYVSTVNSMWDAASMDLIRFSCHAAIALLSSVALADTLVNDTFPDKYSFRIAAKARQLVWMLLGAGLTGLAFVNLRYYKDYSQAVWVFLFGVRCISIAFLDLRYELARLKEGYTKCEISSARST